MDKRGRGGVSRFSIENILSHSAEKFRRGGFFSVSLISGIEKVWIRGGGEYQDFPSKIFSHSAEKLRRGTVECFTNFGYRKTLGKRGGGVSRFSLEDFVSLLRNISLENTLVVQKKFLSKIFLHRREGITVLSEFFVSQDRNEKLCKGTLLVSGNFLVTKKIYGYEGAYHDFKSKFLSHNAENFRKESLLFFRKFLVSKSFMDEKGVSCFSVENFWSQCRKISWASLQCFRKF